MLFSRSFDKPRLFASSFNSVVKDLAIKRAFKYMLTEFGRDIYFVKRLFWRGCYLRRYIAIFVGCAYSIFGTYNLTGQIS